LLTISSKLLQSFQFLVYRHQRTYSYKLTDNTTFTDSVVKYFASQMHLTLQTCSDSLPDKQSIMLTCTFKFKKPNSQ